MSALPSDSRLLANRRFMGTMPGRPRSGPGSGSLSTDHPPHKHGFDMNATLQRNGRMSWPTHDRKGSPRLSICRVDRRGGSLMKASGTSRSHVVTRQARPRRAIPESIKQHPEPGKSPIPPSQPCLHPPRSLSPHFARGLAGCRPRLSSSWRCCARLGPCRLASSRASTVRLVGLGCLANSHIMSYNWT